MMRRSSSFSVGNVKACIRLRPLGRPAARSAEAIVAVRGGGGHSGWAFRLRNNYAMRRVLTGGDDDHVDVDNNSDSDDDGR